MSVQPAEPDEVEAHRMPLLDHLRELRDRLVKSIIALATGMAIGLAVADRIFDWLTAPFHAALESTGVEGGLSIVSSPFEGFSVYLQVSFFAGALLSAPFVAYQIWQFVAPGLYKTERKTVAPLAIASALLFLTGAGFVYYLILPIALPFFLQVLDAQANLSLHGYLVGVVRMMLAFGVCFQLPIVTWFLARLGLIDHRDMTAYFRYSVVAIFVIAAIATPPDVLTQVILAIPLLALYVLSIGIAWAVTTKVR